MTIYVHQGNNIRLGQSRGHVEINMSTKHETKHWLYLACELLEMYITFKGDNN